MRVDFETERLYLRCPVIEDSTAYFAWCGDPMVNRYVTYPLYSCEEDVRSWLSSLQGVLDDMNSYEVTIVLKQTGQIIGSGGLYYVPEHDSWAVGYSLRQDQWGHGYATEAMKGLINYASRSGRVHAIEGSFATENTGSRRVMEKLGMRCVADVTYSKADGSASFDGKMYRREFTGNAVSNQSQRPASSTNTQSAAPDVYVGEPIGQMSGKHVYMVDGQPKMIRFDGSLMNVGMGWYKFLVYFLLWLNCLSCLVRGINMIYDGETNDGLFQYVDEDPHVLLMILGSVLILFSAYACVTAILMLKKRRCALAFLMPYFAVMAVVMFLLTVVGVVTESYISLVYGIYAIIFSIVSEIVTVSYFNARRWYFAR